MRRIHENTTNEKLRSIIEDIECEIDDLRSELRGAEEELDRREREGVEVSLQLTAPALEAVRSLISAGGLTGAEFEALFNATEGVNAKQLQRLRLIFQNHGLDARVVPSIADCACASIPLVRSAEVSLAI